MGSTTLVPPEVTAGSGGPGGFDGWDDGGNSGGGGRPEMNGPVVPAQAYRTGMWVALAAIVMLFAALTSAMVVRRGMANDWIPIPVPRILWLNTLMLLGSSYTLERARRDFSARRKGSFSLFWKATAVLGSAFIAGQWLAWRQLAARGIFLASNPSSSFFYLLTATHGIHLLGGISAMACLVFRARRRILTQTAIDVSAIYWHFMDGLWLYLFLLLSLGR